MKFPQRIHVTIEPDPEEPYLLAYKDGIAAIDHGTKVAVYRLVSEGVANVQRSYVEKKRKK